MKTVIKHGYVIYRTTCNTCGCYFSYELGDIEKGVVTCPDCGNMCSHHQSNFDMASQIDDEE